MAAPAATASCPAGYASVPAGTFWMGSPDGEGQADEHPQHQVTLAAFCMKTTEVTVSEYAACVTAGGCPPAPTTVMWANISNEDRTKRSAFCNAGKADRDSHPINCVDWNHATGYCTWSGGSLPTEEQWEYAARGPDGRIYPWGNDAPSSQLCWKRAPGDVPVWLGTCPVGAFVNGASPFGLHDMAGNVWEWTSSPYCPYQNASCESAERVNRGGRWQDSDPSQVRSAFRLRGDVTLRNVSLGLRCVRSSR
jgi:formylglycine-generating enzyme required for sulfatase activity